MKIKYLPMFVFFLFAVNAASNDFYDIAKDAHEIQHGELANSIDVSEFTSEIPDEILSYVSSIQDTSNQIAVDKFMEEANKHPQLISEFKRERNTAGKILVFASLSMPDTELMSLFRHAAIREDVYIHFRGLVPGDKIGDFYRRIAQLLKDVSPKPNVLLDPVAFKDYEITTVPVILKKGRGDTYTNILYGSVNTDYFKELVEKDPSKKHLGFVGQVYEILEPNLIDVMKERVANVDWDAQKKGAIDNFWKKYEFVQALPIARDTNSFLWDPTLYLSEDVKDPDGNIIAKKGSMYSPFDHGGFHKRVFVFDPTDEKQLSKVIELSAQKVKGLTDIYLATRIDKVKGWDFLQEIENKLRSNIYLIDQGGLQRLRVQKVPSTVEPHGRLMKVTEHPVGAL